MDAAQSTSTTDASLLKLLAMFFSPLAMRSFLEKPPRSSDRLETALACYRNSLLLFRHIDAQINRSAAVVLLCFFLQPVIAFLTPAAIFYVAVAVLMLVATLHATALGIYRQVLNSRIDACADVLGIERPVDHEEAKEFPRSDPDHKAPTLKSTRKLPLRERSEVRPPR